MDLKVAVIILCYNQVDLTLGCLDSVVRQNYQNFEVCLVDNGSTDGTVPQVSQKFPDVRWVLNRKNLGYALGNNKGIEFSLQQGADVVFLINNDTFLENGCIGNLLHVLSEKPQVGVVGPMVHTWDGDRTISSAGGAINWKMADSINVGMGEKDLGQFHGREVDFINGCGIMVKKEAVLKTGGLDPKYFMYWEETDWCRRVKKAGFELFFEPKALMNHKAPIHSVELGPTTLYYMTRNRFLFFYRHSPTAVKTISLLRALKGTVSGILLNQRNNKPVHARAMQYALKHAVTNRWGYTDPQLWLRVS